MDIDQFINQANGTHIDEDGYYGAQCWDLVAKYARVVWGCPSFPTGSGGAEGLYRLFQDPIPQYFDRISGGYQKGDVIVWMASFSPPYGHTAICISFDGTTLTVLEQNGNNPGGNAYIKTRSLSGVSGALRPKGTNMVSQADFDGLKKELETERATYEQWIADRDGTITGLRTELDAERKGYEGQIAELVATSKLKDQRILDLQKSVPGSTEVEQPVVTPVIPTGRSLWQVIGDFFSQFKKG